MNSCDNVKGLAEWQVNRLHEHLSKHRYYLGEKGIQLDNTALECDFFKTYIKEVAKELRIEFCSNICEHREGCELGKFFVDNGD